MHRGQTLTGSDMQAERDVNSWVQSVEEKMNTLSSGIDNSPDITDIVDDKEIATRSVAFVVNSTRKGIVPLCADVANLFKAKYSLERKVHELRRDNNILKSSLSSSPTSYSHHAFQPNQLSRSCSRCSQCSSTASIPRQSPKLDIPRLRRTKPSLAHDLPDIYPCMISAPSSHEPSITDTPTAWTTTHYLPEIVSQPNCDIPKVSPRTSQVLNDSSILDSTLQERFNTSQQLNQQLTDELETARQEILILRERLAELEKLTQVSRTPVSQSFHVENEITGSNNSTRHESPPGNAAVTNDGSATTVPPMAIPSSAAWTTPPHSPKTLTGDVALNSERHEQSLLASKYANKPNFIEDEVVTISTNVSVGSQTSSMAIAETSFSDIPHLVGGDASIKSGDISSHASSAKQQSASNVPRCAPSDLPGQDIAPCDLRVFSSQSDASNDIHTPPQVTTNSGGPRQIKSLMSCALSHGKRVMLGDSVRIKGDRSGVIRYIGPLDDQSHDIYAGVELSHPGDGAHDGTVDNRRYFKCPKHRGLLVPISDIVSLVGEKTVASDYGSDSDTGDRRQPGPPLAVKPPPPAKPTFTGRPREKKYRKRRTPTPDSTLDKRCSLPV